MNRRELLIGAAATAVAAMPASGICSTTPMFAGVDLASGPDIITISWPAGSFSPSFFSYVVNERRYRVLKTYESDGMRHVLLEPIPDNGAEEDAS